MQIGNGNANAIFTKQIQFGDTLAPCLALNYSLGQIAGELTSASYWKATSQITEPSSHPVIIITLKSRTTAGALTGGTFTAVACTDITYTITGAAAKVAWAGTTPTFTASASTLKEAIDLLNEVPGLQAFALHAPHSMPLDNAYFLVAAEADIPTQPGEYLETLYRDINAYVIVSDGAVNNFMAYMRVGVPELRDAGSMKLIGVSGKNTETSTVNGGVRIYRDDIRDYGSEFNAVYDTEITNKQLYLDKALVLAETAYVADNIENAVTIQGPIIVEVRGTDLLTTTLTLKLMQATI